MEETINTFAGLPQFIWEGIFNIIVALGAGLIIAFVTCPLQKVNPSTKRVLIHKLIIKTGGKTKKI